MSHSNDTAVTVTTLESQRWCGTLPGVSLEVILASKGSRAPGAREAAGVEVLLHVAPEVGYVLDSGPTQLAGQALP